MKKTHAILLAAILTVLVVIAVKQHQLAEEAEHDRLRQAAAECWERAVGSGIDADLCTALDEEAAKH